MTFPVVDSREVEVPVALHASDAVADHRIAVDNSPHFQEAYVEVDNDAAVDIVVDEEWGVTGLRHHHPLVQLAVDHHDHFLCPVVSGVCWIAPLATATSQLPLGTTFSFPID